VPSAIYHKASRRRRCVHSAFSDDVGINTSVAALPHFPTFNGLGCIKIVQNHRNLLLSVHLSLLLISWVFLRDPSDPVRPDRHVSPLISPYVGRRSVGVVMELG
jgi:hypothetical protein